MLLDPVKKRDLVLCKLVKNLGLLVSVTELCCHILGNVCDPCIACMLVE